MRASPLFAFAAPLVSAIQLLEPFANSLVAKGQMHNITWTSVDTDPQAFSIFLVNFVDYPPFYTKVAANVPTCAGQFEVIVPCEVNSSYGFQFNAINGNNVYDIYAQTAKFYVEGSCESVSGCLTK
ncbi:hypothetical protein C8A05DRAFT_12439 [Staphylotrichum tortipilum]|uniref:Yeast cell wall synthesis Kre9/Knh1-like N-terminal domain-containing protein n=1 Tax=Staphylotrichum tortipilum TaxID=2831512 RepID=A0AAN6MSD4_9PEZI|nr:hypothetical protein C8A05DRAFT_12439 [Staphylotrichum longicolle]